MEDYYALPVIDETCIQCGQYVVTGLVVEMPPTYREIFWSVPAVGLHLAFVDQIM